MFKIRSEDDASTARSPAYAILAIDSEDRFKSYVEARAATGSSYNNSPYNFQITKNESMMNGFFTRLALTEMCFPWTVPNINVQTQDIIVTYITVGAPVVTTITLDVGFYKPADLAAAIQAAVRALDPALAAFDLAYGSDAILGGARKSPTFFYNCTGGGYTIAFDPLPYNSAAYPYPATTKQLFDVMGFSTDNTFLSAQGVSQTTLCQAIRAIDIVCNQLTYNQSLKDTMSQPIARDTLCRLYIGDGPYTGTSTVDPSDPLFCPPGCAPFVIYRQYTNPKYIRWMPNQPVQGNLQFQVYDDNGQILTNVIGFDGSENWSMTLLVSED